MTPLSAKSYTDAAAVNSSVAFAKNSVDAASEKSNLDNK